jgi:hypothetical protein
MLHGEARRCLIQVGLLTHCGHSLTRRIPLFKHYKTVSLFHHFVRLVFYNSLIRHLGASITHHGPSARDPEDGLLCVVAGPDAAIDCYWNQSGRRRCRLFERNTIRALVAPAGRQRAGRGAQAGSYRRCRVKVYEKLLLPDPDKTDGYARFNDIAWSQPSEQYPRGIIAGALDSGALVLWDAEKLQAGEGYGCNSCWAWTWKADLT